jgi:hypothetical protein
MHNYNLEKDSLYCSTQLASVLLALGYDQNDFESTSIDDAVSTIRTRYAYSPEITHLGPTAATVAVSEFLKYQNIIYSRTIRRAWFDVQICNYEIANAK